MGTGDHTFSYHGSQEAEEPQSKRLNIDNEATYLQREQVNEYSVETEKCQSIEGEVFGDQEMAIGAESQTIVMTEKGERVTVVPGQFVLTAGRAGLLVRDGQRIDQGRDPS